MASKSHVESTNEKKLRPVYDCLDFGNNKKALQETEKLLKKQKDFQCAKVLKALALVRLGRSEEALPILHEVHVEKPSNEATLQAMGICYKETLKLDLIADMYDNACKAKPDNEEFLTQLFMAYVRLGNYKKQQQTALQLHKLRPDNNPYHYWGVMSIVLQAEESDQKLAKTMFLPLAEKMAKKQIESNKVESNAEIVLMLIILDKLGKYEEALKIIQGDLGERLGGDAHFKDVKVAELYSKLQNWPEGNATYKRLILKNPDSWQDYKGYFTTLLAILEAGWSPSPADAHLQSDMVDYTSDMAVRFLNERVQLNSESRQIDRGPYLAQMELFRLLKERSMDCSVLGLLDELILRYYSLFGDKYCCFEDLAAYWCLLDEDGRVKVLTSVQKEVQNLLVEGGKVVFASTVKQMQRHIFQLQIEQYFRAYNSPAYEHVHSMVDDMFSRYLNGISVEKDAISTDLKTCDNYLLLGVFRLLDAWIHTKEQALLLKACSWLETGIRCSPANYHFKIMLIKVYSELGVFGPVPALLVSLDLKHMQYDTLGYLFSNDALRWGHISAASLLFNPMLKFFTASGREIGENLISCYRYGTFAKVEEFIKFKNRLQNSCQFASGTSERLLIELVDKCCKHQDTEQAVLQAAVDPQQDATNWRDLVDNRDFDVLPKWTLPELGFSKSLQQASFKEEKDWLKFRNLTVRILSAAVQMATDATLAQHTERSVNGGASQAASSSSTAEDDKTSVLTELLCQYDKHTEECVCSATYLQPASFHTHGPSATRIRSFLKLGHAALLSQFAHAVLHTHSVVTACDRVNVTDAADIKQGTQFEDLAIKYKDIIGQAGRQSILSPRENDGSGVTIWLHPPVLEDNVLHVEMLAYYIVLLGACWKMVKHASTSTSGKRRLKKQQQASASKDPTAPESLKLVAELLAESAGILDCRMIGMAEELQQLLPERIDASLCLGHDLCGTPVSSNDTSSKDEQEKRSASAMWINVEKSYRQSFKEMTDFIKHKKQYLLGLVF